MSFWHSDPDDVWTVAAYGVEVGELDTAQAVLDFFEKPWNWPELHQAWLDSEDEET